MDGAGAIRTRGGRVRAICALAGLLCALGVVSAAVARADTSGPTGAPHRHPGPAHAALVALVDGQGANVRTVSDVATATTSAVGTAQRGAPAASTPATDTGVVTTAEVRTRGPPAAR